MRKTRRLLSVVKGFICDKRKILILVFILGLLASFLEIANTYLFKILVDNVFIKKNISIQNIIVLFSVVFVGTSICTYVKNYLVNKFDLSVSKLIKEKIWNSYCSMRIEKFLTYDVGELKNVIDYDSRQISQFVLQFYVEYPLNLMKLCVCVCILYFFSWQLSLLATVLIPITFLLGRYFSNKNGELWYQSRQISGKFETWLFDMFQRWMDIKLLTQENSVMNTFDEYAEEIIENKSKFMFYYSISRIVALMKNEIFVKLVIYTLGGYLVIKGQITVGVMLVFVQYLGKMLNYLETINDYNINVTKYNEQITRVIDVLNIETYKEEEANCYSIEWGDVVLKNISFSYNNSQNKVISDFSDVIHKGEVVALRGKSGVGKTTLVNLILNQIKPQKGQILFGQEDLSSATGKGMLARISTISQDTRFFNLTIFENMQIVKPDVSEDELISVMKKVDIYSFVEALPDGMNTVIGERGIKLSGGQRQKMAFVRLFLTNPDFIILDEATSMMDGDSEKLVYQSLLEWKKERTLLIISHRLETVWFINRYINL